MAIVLNSNVDASGGGGGTENSAPDICVWVNTGNGIGQGMVCVLDWAGIATPGIAIANQNRFHVRIVTNGLIDATRNLQPAILTGQTAVLFEGGVVPVGYVGDPVYLSAVDEGTVTVDPPTASGTVVVRVGTIIASGDGSPYAQVRLDPEVQPFINP